MLCTDVEQSFKVDWVVQYDAPEDSKDFIRRASYGSKSLLFLVRHELSFIE